MKKTLLIILTLAMLLSLCACGGGDANNDVGTTPPKVEDNNTSGSSGSSGSTGTTEEKSALWETYYYVDDFNQPTNDYYVGNSTYFLGTFSNSATTDSSLLVDIIVDTEDVTIFLYEYGSHQVKNNSSYYDDTYNIKMRTANGTTYSFTGTMYCGDDRIFVEESYISKVISALCQTGNANISFYIEDAERTTTNYLFTAVSSNFAEEYRKLSK